MAFSYAYSNSGLTGKPKTNILKYTKLYLDVLQESFLGAYCD